jgi:hypothetical protein
VTTSATLVFGTSMCCRNIDPVCIGWILVIFSVFILR